MQKVKGHRRWWLMWLVPIMDGFARLVGEELPVFFSRLAKTERVTLPMMRNWIKQQKMMDILDEYYAEEDHVLVFDNVTTHTKRADGALSARSMLKSRQE
jgi:hypothetical protein